MKKFTRVMAALVCGAIVASSASVSAFAASNDGIHINTPGGYVELRKVNVAPVDHAEVSVNRTMAACGVDDVVVTVKPEAGYKVVDVKIDSYSQVSSAGMNGVYTFQMPWCDESTGVTVTAVVAPIK